LLASSPDEPGWTPAFFQTFLDTLDRAREDSARDYLGYVNPSVEGDDRFYDWFVRYIRAAGSPAALRNILHENVAIDLEGRAEAVRAPTLLLHRVGDAWVSLASAQDVAKRIPGAKLIELPGIDHWPWLGDSDAVLAEIETFVTGARPSRRRPEWGPRSLTKRETEVARLAADGLSSAEIGARLHIGERTVETHLSNAYLKLGISSRVELARRANEFAI
jgi:DNA-binding CsgD family transcriptional regulator